MASPVDVVSNYFLARGHSPGTGSLRISHSPGTGSLSIIGSFAGFIIYTIDVPLCFDVLIAIECNEDNTCVYKANFRHCIFQRFVQDICRDIIMLKYVLERKMSLW